MGPVLGFSLLLASVLLITVAVTGAPFSTAIRGQAPKSTAGGTPLKNLPGA